MAANQEGSLNMTILGPRYDRVSESGAGNRLASVLSFVKRNRAMIEAQRGKISAESRAKKTAYRRRYLAAIPQARAASRLRTSLRAAMFSARQRMPRLLDGILGCSIPEFREHIEAQFTPGMTWENHGRWHLDHYLPCCAFDLTHELEVGECFHFTNIRPVWARENFAKIATDMPQSVWPKQSLTP